MRAWPLLLVVLLTACTTRSSPAPAREAEPERMDLEQSADWAVRTLDPCGLLGSRGTLVTPRACQFEEGPGRQITVHVGGEINHFARYRSQLLDVDGLRVYLSYQPGGPYTAVSCRLGIPISYTRAVWITAEWGEGVDHEQQCVAARAHLPTVLDNLRDPGALPAGEGTLLRWTACELLERALGRRTDPTFENIRAVQAGDPARADDCGWGDESLDGLRLDLSVRAPDTDGEPVRVGDITARRHASPTGSCALTWPQDRRAGGTANIISLGGPKCDTVMQAAPKILAVLDGPAPEVPPAPATLGIPSDEPDHAGDPECVISALEEPGCRAHREVSVPPDGQGIMEMAATADGVDLACTLLADAITSATGREGQVAYTEEKCVGTTADRGVDFSLSFDTSAKLPEWDDLGARITIAGFPAIRWERRGNRDLALSDSPDPSGIGRVFLNAYPAAPLGEATPERPDDPARLAVTDRVAEAIMSRF